MSDLNPHCQLSDSKDCPPSSSKPTHQLLLTRDAKLGDDLIIRRALPHQMRRMIGAWCFLDHFGPLDLKNSKGMNVAPHPHIGLQTVTWLLEGKILHRDSLGNEQIISPGELNLMTAGNGIAHSEESIHDQNSRLHGVQLWIALPNANRSISPQFEHYSTLPIIKKDDLHITVIAGELFGERACTTLFSPLVGLDIQVIQNNDFSIPLNPTFEYGILPLHGEVIIENETVTMGKLLYLGSGRDELIFHASKDSHFLIVGGQPFNEEILLWWNFVARTKAEIIKSTNDWQSHQHFPEVKGYQGNRLSAPEIPW